MFDKKKRQKLSKSIHTNAVDDYDMMMLMMVMYDTNDDDDDDGDYHVILIGSNSGANSYRRKHEADVNADGGIDAYIYIFVDIWIYSFSMLIQS